MLKIRRKPKRDVEPFIKELNEELDNLKYEINECKYRLRMIRDLYKKVKKGVIK